MELIAPMGALHITQTQLQHPFVNERCTIAHLLPLIKAGGAAGERTDGRVSTAMQDSRDRRGSLTSPLCAPHLTTEKMNIWLQHNLFLERGRVKIKHVHAFLSEYIFIRISYLFICFNKMKKNT